MYLEPLTDLVDRADDRLDGEREVLVLAEVVVVRALGGG
jgi:hypothetical protein